MVSGDWERIVGGAIRPILSPGQGSESHEWDIKPMALLRLSVNTRIDDWMEIGSGPEGGCTYCGGSGVGRMIQRHQVILHEFALGVDAVLLEACTLRDS